MENLTFIVTAKQRRQADRLLKAHARYCQVSQYNLPTWRFAPTGIGTVVIAICCRCGADFDVTDYKSW